jgi:hypothetical protein
MSTSSESDEEHSLRHNFFFPDFLKRKIFYLSISYFIAGLFFRNEFFVNSILDIFYSLTSKHLDTDFRQAGFSMVGSALLLFGFIMMLYTIAGNEKSLISAPQFFLISGFSIITFYWATLLRCAVNIPITDDYYTILNFLNHYIHADVSQQFKMIFTPYVETRIITTRIITIGLLKTAGFINFKWFVVIVNMALTGIGYLFYKKISESSDKAYLLIPVLLFIFQFSYYDAQLWTTAGIHITVTLFFALSTFFFLEKNRTFFFCNFNHYRNRCYINLRKRIVGFSCRIDHTSSKRKKNSTDDLAYNSYTHCISLFFQLSFNQAKW